MSVPAYRTLRDASRHSLASVRDPKRIILIHSGITLAVSLLLVLANYLLDLQISKGTGLSSFGTRSALETAQRVLMLIRSIALPFWQMGYIFYTLKTAQGTDVGSRGLLAGFQRFGAILRLRILMIGILILVAVISTYISSMIFSLTPWSAQLMDAMAPLMEGTADEATILAVYQSIPLSVFLPLLIIILCAFLALIIPVFYRYRMADLWLMDHPNQGALAALHNSRKIMKGNAVAVFKIDLRFWWFFVPELLIALLAYGDLLLEACGLPLPFGENGAFYLFYILSAAAQLGLYYWKQNDVSVTYAHVYEALKPTAEEQPKLWNV